MKVSVHHIVLETLRFWLPLVVGLSVMAGVVYGTVQQSYRQSANDPQIEVAEDIAAAIAGGEDPTSFVGSRSIDMAKSLATWVLVVDKTNASVASDVVLESEVPVPPAGVLDTARHTGQNRVTWQPRPDVRSAIVAAAVPGNSGQVVVVGRSLREVEKRESRLGLMVLGAWLAAVIGSLILYALAGLLTPQRPKEPPV